MDDKVNLSKVFGDSGGNFRDSVAGSIHVSFVFTGLWGDVFRVVKGGVERIELEVLHQLAVRQLARFIKFSRIPGGGENFNQWRPGADQDFTAGFCQSLGNGPAVPL